MTIKAQAPGKVGRPRKKRGAPVGNQNARKHGFYSKVLTPTQEAALKASSVEGLDKEIALVRVKISSILSNDPQNIRALMLALSALARLVRTRHLPHASLPPQGLVPLSPLPLGERSGEGGGKVRMEVVS